MPTWRTQVQMDYPGPGSPGFNTFHCRNNLGDNALDQATEAITTFYDTIQPVFPSSTRITIGGLWTGVGDDIGSASQQDATTLDGAGGGARSPELLCLLANWTTDGPGRRGRGRSFLGPLSLTCISGVGGVDPGIRSLVNQAMAALVEDSDSGNNWAMGLYSQANQTFYDWTGGVSSPTFAYLSTRRD